MLTSVTWIGTKYWIDMYGSLMMYPNDFGDPLTSHLDPA